MLSFNHLFTSKCIVVIADNFFNNMKKNINLDKNCIIFITLNSDLVLCFCYYIFGFVMIFNKQWKFFFFFFFCFSNIAGL